MSGVSLLGRKPAAPASAPSTPALSTTAAPAPVAVKPTPTPAPAPVAKPAGRSLLSQVKAAPIAQPVVAAAVALATQSAEESAEEARAQAEEGAEEQVVEVAGENPPTVQVLAKNAKMGGKYWVHFSTEPRPEIVTFIARTKGGLSFGRAEGKGAITLQDEDVLSVAEGVLPPDSAPAGATGSVAEPLPPTAIVSPAVRAAAVVAPAPQAEATAPKPRGRPKGSTSKKTETAAAPTQTELPGTAQIVGTTEETNFLQAEGFSLYVNAMPVRGAHAQNLEEFIASRAAQIAKAAGVGDIAFAPKESPLNFGGWKGALREVLRAEPPVGTFFVITRGSDLADVAVEALSPLAKLVVRGI